MSESDSYLLLEFFKNGNSIGSKPFFKDFLVNHKGDINELGVSNVSPNSNFYDLSFFKRQRGWQIQKLNRDIKIYINNQELIESATLKVGDRIQLKGFELNIHLISNNYDLESGKIFEEIITSDDYDLYSVEEDKRIIILSKITKICVNQPIEEKSLFKQCLELIAEYFPQAQRKTILTYQDGELLPRVFIPIDNSNFSFTLAKICIEKKTSFIWSRRFSKVESADLPSSLFQVLCAIYVPIICGDKIYGMIHLDSIFEDEAFNNRDLQLITIIANILGSVLNAKITKRYIDYPSVFISYSHNEKEFVTKLAKNLRKNQIRVWFDERIQPGRRWRIEIAEAIKYTDIFLWVVSSSSLNSDIVSWEMNIARSNNKKFIPLVYEQNCELPDWTKDIQYIKLDLEMDQLVKTLSKRIKECCRHEI